MKLFPALLKPVVPVLIMASGLAAQTALRPLHTPAEILQIMNDSKLVYQISADYHAEAAADTPLVLSNQMLLVKTDTGYILTAYVLSDPARRLRDRGEDAFARLDFPAAIRSYDSLMSLDPTYYFALTLIGDSYYREGRYDTAVVYFRKAIQNNFADYDAHWFLADAYGKLSMPDSALKEITIAYLLNVNHENLGRAIRIRRADAGHPWVEWDFIPEYSISKKGNDVSIEAPPLWLGYAMVKAVWKYEPGYADSMIGAGKHNFVIDWPEEKEALLAFMVDSVKGARVKTIAEAGYLTEFVLFEITARRYPSVMALLPRDEFYRVVDYVNKFH